MKPGHSTLLIVPAALMCLSIFLAREHGPYSLAANSDPEYCYLFNSLSILRLNVPGHIDHPGTTLQEIGSGVVFARWVVGSKERWIFLERAVLSDPEAYLRSIHLALTFILGAAVFLAGASFYGATRSLAASLLLQLSFFLFPDNIYALPRVSPEPLLIATVFLLIGVLARVLYQPRGGSERYAWFAGALFGFGVVTKITFLPLGAVIFFFTGWRAKIRFAIAAAISAFALTLPIWPKYRLMATWFWSLLIHSGKYGAGRVGLPNRTELADRLAQLYQSEPAIFYFLACYLLMWGWLRFFRHQGDDLLVRALLRLLPVACAAIAIQLAITLKHYAAHYIIPALVFVAFVNAAIFLLVSRSAFSTLPGLSLRIVGIAALAIGFVTSYDRVGWWSTELHSNVRASEQLAKARVEAGDCVTIGYYRSSAPGFALDFGSQYTDFVHAPALKLLYPGSISYNRFGGGFRSFAGESRLAEVDRLLTGGRCVLMQGSAPPDGPPVLPAQFALQPVAAAGKEALYRLSLVLGSR